MKEFFISEEEQIKFSCALAGKSRNASITESTISSLKDSGFFHTNSPLHLLFKELGLDPDSQGCKKMKSIFMRVGQEGFENYNALVREVAGKFQDDKSLFCDFMIFFTNLVPRKNYAGYKPSNYQSKFEICNLINSNFDKAYEIFIENKERKTEFLQEIMGRSDLGGLGAAEFQQFYIVGLKEKLGVAANISPSEGGDPKRQRTGDGLSSYRRVDLSASVDQPSASAAQASASQASTNSLNPRQLGNG